MSNFKWADAPPPIHTKPKSKKVSEIDTIITRLRKATKNRGRWALVKADVHYTYITRVNKLLKDRAMTDMQFTTRKNKNGKWDLWGTWNKPVAVPAEPETPATTTESTETPADAVLSGWLGSK